MSDVTVLPMTSGTPGPPGPPAPPHNFTQSILTGDWTLLGPYYYVDLVHNFGVPAVQVTCFNGSDQVLIDRTELQSTNITRIYVLASPDERFAGTAVVLV
jgi:hypothetical protein